MSESENLQKIQLNEQRKQAVSAQRQQIEQQLLEIESALEEMKDDAKTYKIIGSIMIAKDPKELRKDLEDKKEKYNLRIKAFEKQEKKIDEDTEALRKEVMQKMKKNG